MFFFTFIVNVFFFKIFNFDCLVIILILIYLKNNIENCKPYVKGMIYLSKGRGYPFIFLFFNLIFDFTRLDNTLKYITLNKMNQNKHIYDKERE